MLRRQYLAILLAIAAPPAVSAQNDNPLPEIPLGSVPVYLSSFTTGLPVQEEFVTPVFTQRVGPTDLAEVPNASGSLVVTTYGGTAFLLSAAGKTADTAFLDLRSPASPTYNPAFEFGDAHGLTSIAFHPGFNEPTSSGYRRFYTIEPETSGSGVPDFVESVVPGDHHQEAVYEYTLESTTATICGDACAASKRELLRVQQPGWHHNLGDLLFDHEGRLYIASADGSTAGRVPPLMSDNASSLSNVFGKILRIDPFGNDSANGQYGIPDDNPFTDGPGTNVDEIYAYGLRNPYRIEFDSFTGEMYASETGEESIESVERITAGGNFGWNVKEGSYVYDRTTKLITVDIDSDGNGRGDFAETRGLIDPVFEYDRDEGRAIVGAVPYRGDAIPALTGKIIFADFSGRLFYGDLESGQEFQTVVDAAGESVPFNVHSVNRDAAGDVYVLGIIKQGDDYDGVIAKLYAKPMTEGDTNGDGVLDGKDIDLLSRILRSGSQERLFDLSRDGVIDNHDRMVWVNELQNTYLGDANLDGEWNASDLVAVLTVGEYEDEVPHNSGWAEGDWNGDGDFTSQDIVVAFAAGGYENGPRPAIGVPEPSTGLLLWFAFGCRVLCRRPRLAQVSPRCD